MPGSDISADALDRIVHGSPWSEVLDIHDTTYLYENITNHRFVVSFWFYNAPGPKIAQLGWDTYIPVFAGTIHALTIELDPGGGIWVAGPNPSSQFAFQILMVEKFTPQEPEKPDSGIPVSPAHVVGLNNFISELEVSLSAPEKDPKEIRDQLEQARRLLRGE